MQVLLPMLILLASVDMGAPIPCLSPEGCKNFKCPELTKATCEGKIIPPKDCVCCGRCVPALKKGEECRTFYPERGVTDYCDEGLKCNKDTYTCQ